MGRRSKSRERVVPQLCWPNSPRLYNDDDDDKMEDVEAKDSMLGGWRERGRARARDPIRSIQLQRPLLIFIPHVSCVHLCSWGVHMCVWGVVVVRHVTWAGSRPMMFVVTG
jgi:hypothetical protein